MKSGRTCTKITDFYTYVDEISDVLNGTDELREDINLNIGKEKEDNVAPLLRKLYENALKNTSNSRGNRHSETIVTFAAALYCLIGRSGYDMLLENLKFALPSVPTVQRIISKEKKLHEGEFHFDELVQHLTKFNSPMIVNIHLDDTRIIHRVDYNSETDTFVGLCLPLSEKMLPICNTFRLDTFEDIKAALQNNIVAKYAHCIVAQPVDVQAPSFVLFIMGTDSTYDATVITERWKHIEEELKKRAVRVLSFGADGAGPFLKAMVAECQLFRSVSGGGNSTQDWDFLLMPEFPKNAVFCQDIIHVLAKLRTKLITPSNTLILGERLKACRTHVELVCNTMPKDQHGLNNRCINHKDKQNYESINSLVSQSVMACLEKLDSEKKMNTQGTIIYLCMIRDIRDAFLDKSISPLRRLFLMWKSVFFLRIWRTWLDENGYPECEHFITANAYTCVEINAHMLVTVVKRVAEGELPVDCLRVWKMGSQACEQLFRMLRSMTPTFSTIINFSLNGLLQKTHKLRYLSGAEACNDIEFPRARRRLLQLNNETNETLRPPSVTDIKDTVVKSKSDAIKLAKSCQMGIKSTTNAYLAAGRIKMVDLAVTDDGERDDDTSAFASSTEMTEAPLCPPFPVDNEILEDLQRIRMVKSKDSSFPIYVPDTNDRSNSSRTYSKRGFVTYGEKHIRKSTALYLLQENIQLSNDRLLRVREQQASHLMDSENVDILDSFVKVGDYCIFKRIDHPKFIIGRVIQFSYLYGNKRDRQYSATFVDISNASYKDIGVLCDWYVLCDDISDGVIFLEEDTQTYSVGFVTMEQYYCKIETSEITVCDSRLSMTISAIKGTFPQWKECLTFQDVVC